MERLDGLSTTYKTRIYEYAEELERNIANSERNIANSEKNIKEKTQEFLDLM
jgi:hypothetical protein